MTADGAHYEFNGCRAAVECLRAPCDRVCKIERARRLPTQGGAGGPRSADKLGNVCDRTIGNSKVQQRREVPHHKGVVHCRRASHQDVFELTSSGSEYEPYFVEVFRPQESGSPARIRVNPSPSQSDCDLRMHRRTIDGSNAGRRDRTENWTRGQLGAQQLFDEGRAAKVRMTDDQDRAHHHHVFDARAGN